MGADSRDASRPTPSPRRVIAAYLVVSVISTLAASIIWGINTLFLMDAGLDIFRVMLVNSSFTVGQLIFEVPTGVIADTIGRRASLLLGALTLMTATLLYVASAHFQWGLWAFVGASVLIGLGFTFQTGATDAWLVDALHAVGYARPMDRVFAWGGMAFGSAMLVGTLAGGALGQIDLALPYLVRSGLLALCIFVTAALITDIGFEPRPLKLRCFADETRKIFDAGVKYGWRHRVVRPLLWVSFTTGVFFLFGFYAWQRYALDLLGRELIWVAGVLAAGSSLAGIVGNAFVGRIMREGSKRRDPARVLAVCTAVLTACTVVIGLVGIVAPTSGLAPFLLAAAVWMGWGVVFGIIGPVRQTFLNEQIASAQRATVLSLDAFFADVGGAAGQPALGYLAKMTSIPIAWVSGSVFLGVAVPLYRRAGSAARARDTDDVQVGGI